MKQNIDINKLPSEVRAQYKRFKVMHAEKKIQRKAKDDFMAFTKDKYAFGYNDFVVGPVIYIKKKALKHWA